MQKLSVLLLVTAVAGTRGCATPDNAPSGDAGLLEITLRGTSQSKVDQSSDSAQLTLSAPAGTSSGDVMLVAITTLAGVAVTRPAGFTVVGMQDDNGMSGAEAIQSTLFVHVAGSTEPAAYSFGLNPQACALASLAAFSNVDTRSPINATASAAADDVATKMQSTPHITTDVPGTVLVGVFSGAAKTELTQTDAALVNKLAIASCKQGDAWNLNMNVYSSAPRDTSGDQGSRAVTFSVATDTATMMLVALTPRQPSGVAVEGCASSL